MLSIKKGDSFHESLKLLILSYLSSMAAWPNVQINILYRPRVFERKQIRDLKCLISAQLHRCWKEVRSLNIAFLSKRESWDLTISNMKVC